MNTADVSTESGYARADGTKVPVRVRLDTWAEGDGCSLYLSPKAARDISASLAIAADAAEDGELGSYGKFEWQE